MLRQVLYILRLAQAQLHFPWSVAVRCRCSRACATRGRILRLTQAQTAAFISIQLLHLGFLATARSIHRSAFTFSPFSNRWVLLGMGVTFACMLLIVYVPVLQTVFRTAPLPLEWWPVILLGLFPGFIAVEIEKAIRARLGRPGAPSTSG